jgi:hypothetical protein
MATARTAYTLFCLLEQTPSCLVCLLRY